MERPRADDGNPVSLSRISPRSQNEALRHSRWFGLNHLPTCPPAGFWTQCATLRRQPSGTDSLPICQWKFVRDQKGGVLARSDGR